MKLALWPSRGKRCGDNMNDKKQSNSKPLTPEELAYNQMMIETNIKMWDNYNKQNEAHFNLMKSIE